MLLLVILLAVISTPNLVSGDHGELYSHIFSGGFSSASDLKYQIEDSKGTGNYYRRAAQEWSKQSSRVSLSEAAQHASAQLYFMDSINGPQGSYGLMIPYYRDSRGNYQIDYDATRTWTHAYVELYVNRMSDFSYENYMFVTLHELGHALSLAHNNTLLVSTVMRTNLGVLSHTTPTSTDRDHIHQKWGQ